jgi:hypothetical protein
MKTSSPLSGYLSAKDLAIRLSISDERARQLIASLPHIDVRAPGAKKALLRVRWDIFEKWLSDQDRHRSKVIRI